MKKVLKVPISNLKEIKRKKYNNKNPNNYKNNKGTSFLYIQEEKKKPLNFI